MQVQAREAYVLFVRDAWHRSLHFKQVNARKSIYSVRIGKGFRAIGKRYEDGTIVWFWVGSHADYDQLLRSL